MLLSRRFTEQFVKKARSVTCVDFLPSAVAVNRKAHGACGNVSFIDLDVTKLEQPKHRFLHMSAVFPVLRFIFLDSYLLQIMFSILVTCRIRGN